MSHNVQHYRYETVPYGSPYDQDKTPWRIPPNSNIKRPSPFRALPISREANSTEQRNREIFTSQISTVRQSLNALTRRISSIQNPGPLDGLVRGALPFRESSLEMGLSLAKNALNNGDFEGAMAYSKNILFSNENNIEATRIAKISDRYIKYLSQARKHDESGNFLLAAIFYHQLSSYFLQKPAFLKELEQTLFFLQTLTAAMKTFFQSNYVSANFHTSRLPQSSHYVKKIKNLIDEGDQLQIMAQRRFRENKIDEALVLASKILVVHPENPIAKAIYTQFFTKFETSITSNSGDFFLNHYSYDLALIIYQKHCPSNQQTPICRNHFLALTCDQSLKKAMSDFKKGNFVAAKNEIQKVLHYFPNDSIAIKIQTQIDECLAQLMQARKAVEENKFGEAITNVFWILLINPTHSEALEIVNKGLDRLYLINQVPQPNINLWLNS